MKKNNKKGWYTIAVEDTATGEVVSVLASVEFFKRRGACPALVSHFNREFKLRNKEVKN